MYQNDQSARRAEIDSARRALVGKKVTFGKGADEQAGLVVSIGGNAYGASGYQIRVMQVVGRTSRQWIFDSDLFTQGLLRVVE